jgi:hypothetical protein
VVFEFEIKRQSLSERSVGKCTEVYIQQQHPGGRSSRSWDSILRTKAALHLSVKQFTSVQLSRSKVEATGTMRLRTSKSDVSLPLLWHFYNLHMFIFSYFFCI